MAIQNLKKEEINRKLLHLLALLIPGGVFYFPQIPGVPPRLAQYLLLFLLLGSLAVEQARLRFPSVQRIVHGCLGHMMRPEERYRMAGSTWIFASGFLCSLIFPDDITFMVMSIFIVGDGAAAIVGLSIGRTRIGRKSLEGSAACCAVALFVFLGRAGAVAGCPCGVAGNHRHGARSAEVRAF
jgi:dolichol kinase